MCVFVFFFGGGGMGDSRKKKLTISHFKNKDEIRMLEGRGPGLRRGLCAQGKVSGSFPHGLFHEYII